MVTQKTPDSFKSLMTLASNTGSIRQGKRGTGFGSVHSATSVELTGNIRARLDYLVFVGRTPSLSDLENALRSTFGVQFDWSTAKPGARGKFYQLNAVSEFGVALSYNRFDYQEGIEYRVSIGGKPLSGCSMQRLHEFGRWILGTGAKCTRIDVAIDDYERKLDIDELYRCAMAGMGRGFGVVKIVESTKIKGGVTGKTLYLGHPESDRLLRIYDKNIESGGRDNCIRYEVQYRDKQADLVCNDYFSRSSPDDGIRHICGYAVGAVRFVEPRSSVLSRCPNLDWWQEFVDRVGTAVKLSIRRVVPSLSEKKRWVESQVSGTLATIAHCIGWDNAQSWLEVEIRRAYCKHRDRIDLYKTQWKERNTCDSEPFTV